LEEDENGVTRHDEDQELIDWVDSGYYGYVAPQEQFDLEDDLEKENYRNQHAESPDPHFPWTPVLSKWRHRIIAAWRNFRHWMFSWM
jgi:hypothetical protein